MEGGKGEAGKEGRDVRRGAKKSFGSRMERRDDGRKRSRKRRIGWRGFDRARKGGGRERRRIEQTGS